MNPTNNVTEPINPTSHEDLNSPITGQFRSSPFYVALGAPALASVLSIAAAAICYHVLPLDAARDQMAQINTMLLVGGGGGALTGAYGIVARGLEITKGKIKMQLPPEMPQNVNAGTANINAAPVPESTTATTEEGVIDHDNAG